MIAIVLRAVGCLIGLMVIAAPVRAAIITVEFAGTFSANNVPGINAGGAGFSGSFTFDGIDLTSGELRVPSVLFDSGSVAAGATSVLEVVDGDGSPGNPDVLLIELRPAGAVTWPDTGSGSGIVTFWSVELRDDDGSAFPPDFPPALPAFSAWDSALFSMRVDGPCDPPATEPCSASGQLTSFAVRSASVPEPASLPLLVAALGIGLWFAGRRRQQRI
jgi:hypothetical protein